jgi:hypothetical protein
MKSKASKLKLSKETLRGLTDNTLRIIVGGISGEPIVDGCGYTNTGGPGCAPSDAYLCTTGCGSQTDRC